MKLRRYGLLALFVLALIPRLLAIGRYITPDELNWVHRSVLLREAVLAGDWDNTLTTGHPGVTTTWLGATAITAQLMARPDDRAVYEWITQLAWLDPSNVEAFDQLAVFLPAGRTLTAITNTLGLLLIYTLTRRLLGNPTALLASLLLALDPFLAGLSGLLHVDGLLTTWATVSLLALALVISRDEQSTVNGKLKTENWSLKTENWKLIVLAGVSGGLAVLSKSPGVLIVPVTGLFLLVSSLRDWRRETRDFATKAKISNLQSPISGLQSLISNLSIWFVSFGVTVGVLLPAGITAPQQVIQTLSGNAGRHIENALRPTFFLGQANFDHGAWFYPISLMFRLSPIVFAGLLLGFVLLITYLLAINLQRSANRQPPTASGQHPSTTHYPLPTILLLLVWSILFIVGVSQAAKKFDRYILPVWPALTILAAWAWVQFRASLYARRGEVAPRRLNLGLLILVIGQAVFLGHIWPYPLTAYNPLLGGAQAAEQTLTIGWGEGISASAQWLAEQPDSEDKFVVADIAPALVPFYPGRADRLTSDTLPHADYIILTANGRQLDPAGYDTIANEHELIHTIHFSGLDQAWIYQQANPNPEPTILSLPEPLSFDNQVQLLAVQPDIRGRDAWLDVLWVLPQPTTNRYTVRLALEDEAGLVWAQTETDLLNETFFYPEHWQAGETPQVRYRLELPPAIPPAGYTLTLSLFDTASTAQLPILASDDTFRGVVYQSDPITVEPPESPNNTLMFPPPHAIEAKWLDGDLRTLGHGDLPSTAATGERITLDLFWHATTELPADLTVSFQLGDTIILTAPISRYPTEQWRSGETIQEKYTLTIPPDFPAGTHTLTFTTHHAPHTADSTPYTLHPTLNIHATDRLFTLPSDIENPLEVQFTGRAGETIHLYGYTLHTPRVTPGETAELTLYWQVEGQPPTLYTAFVHLLNPDGTNLAQHDQWPGGLPSDTWADGQVIVDRYLIEIPGDAPAGSYPIALGLYTADDGVRLMGVFPAGGALPDNRLILPLSLTITP